MASFEESTGGANGGGQLTERQILDTYRGLRRDMMQLRRKIAELEQENDEHKLVIETLTPMDPSRRAYRLTGGVLVERTVKEVLPSVQSNQAGLGQVLQRLAEDLQKKEAEANAWKIKHNIRSQQDGPMPGGGGAQGEAKSSGVLA